MDALAKKLRLVGKSWHGVGLLLLWWLSACFRTPQASVLWLDRIQFDLPEEWNPTSAEKEALRQGLRKQVLKSKYVHWAAPGRGSHYLQVVALPRGEPAWLWPDNPELPVYSLRIHLVPRHSRGLQLSVAGDLAVLGSKSLQQAFSKLWPRLGKQLALLGHTPQQLLADLQQSDSDIRTAALALAGWQRLTAATPVLSELLGFTDDLAEAWQIIVAMVQIGDTAAVVPIVDWSRQKSPEILRELVMVVGNLGGRMAEGFLHTVATGHSEWEVRQAAEQALTHMLGSKDDV